MKVQKLKGSFRLSVILHPYTAWSYLPFNKRRKRKEEVSFKHRKEQPIIF